MNERYRHKTTLNECQKHFGKLINPIRENYYGERMIDEDDFDNQPQPQQDPNNDNQASQQQDPSMGAADGAPQADAAQAPPMDNGQGDMTDGSGMMDNGMDATQMQPEAPTDFPPMEDTSTDTDNSDNTDEIDVDDLTDAQEKLNKKMNAIGKDYGNTDKLIYSILKGISQITKKIDSSNGRVEALEKEVAKRNPTPIEKLNLRSVNDSYPFNSTPAKYWKDKTANSNYRVTNDDNDGKEYRIYDTDLNDDSNIANSFDFDDDDLTLNGLL